MKWAMPQASPKAPGSMTAREQTKYWWAVTLDADEHAAPGELKADSPKADKLRVIWRAYLPAKAANSSTVMSLERIRLRRVPRATSR